RCRELAAMSVSWRLLCAVGREDLAIDEREGTDYTTMHWDDRGRVRQILCPHRALRLPVTCHRLEAKLGKVTGKTPHGARRRFGAAQGASRSRTTQPINQERNRETP